MAESSPPAGLEELEMIRTIVETYAKLSSAGRQYLMARFSSFAPRHPETKVAQPPPPPLATVAEKVAVRKNAAKTCSFQDCQRKAAGKGLCSAHYLQQYCGLPLTPLLGRGRPGVTRGPMPAETKEKLRDAGFANTQEQVTVNLLKQIGKKADPPSTVDSGRKCETCKQRLLANPRTGTTFHQTEGDLARCRAIQKAGTNGTTPEAVPA